MIIHLHSNSVPLHFVHTKHIAGCIIANLRKLSTFNHMKAPLVVPQTLKWTYTQTNEYNLKNTFMKHNTNLK
jgi:hypothetical protein